MAGCTTQELLCLSSTLFLSFSALSATNNPDPVGAARPRLSGCARQAFRMAVSGAIGFLSYLPCATSPLLQLVPFIMVSCALVEIWGVQPAAPVRAAGPQLGAHP